MTYKKSLIRMQQSQLGAVEAKLSHKIEMLMLVILHISAWACLIKSDYNFVFIMFAYFYIVSKKDSVSISIIFYIVVLLIIMDMFFFLFVSSSWMATQQKNTVWNKLKSMHGFAIFLSVVIGLLKIPLVIFLYQFKKKLAPAK